MEIKKVTYKEIAKYINKSLATIKGWKKHFPELLELVKIGAVCKKNNIDVGDIKKCIEIKNDTFTVKTNMVIDMDTFRTYFKIDKKINKCVFLKTKEEFMYIILETPPNAIKIISPIEYNTDNHNKLYLFYSLL